MLAPQSMSAVVAPRSMKASGAGSPWSMPWVVVGARASAVWIASPVAARRSASRITFGSSQVHGQRLLLLGVRISCSAR